MEEIVLTFAPIPYSIKGERHHGYAFEWPKRCNHCDRQCETASAAELSICSYGINFLRIAPDVTLFGFLVQTQTTSAAHKKMLREYKTHTISVRDLAKISETYAKVFDRFRAEITAQQKSRIDEYENTRRYETDFLDSLRPAIQEAFSFVHDYKQFVARVRQNINVVLESRYPGTELDEKLRQALSAEKAIYWASIIMEEKLQTAFFLLNPDKLRSATDETVFRLHGLVIKYLRIYSTAFAEKNITPRVVGHSLGEIRGNWKATAIIPHTFIDNALKYSQRGGEVEIKFAETLNHIELQVSSFGPRIEPEESDKIFNIFFRADAAKKQEDEGAGFGLYLAQFVASHLGTRIYVTQLSARNGIFGYWTTFSVRFLRAR